MTARMVVYVDVDDTLVRSFGSKRIPIAGMVEHVRRLHRSGVLLYCWSLGGAQYAEDLARELGIVECFVGYLPKPNVVVDDMSAGQWPRFLWVHPNQAMSMSVDDYENTLESPGTR